MAPPSLAGFPPARGAVALIETTGSVTATTDAYEPLTNWPDLAMVQRAGALIGHHGAAEIRTPHKDAVLILPVRRPRRGVTAVRFGRVRGGLEIGLPVLHPG